MSLRSVVSLTDHVDEVLVGLAQDGDVRAEAELLERYRPYVSGMARKYFFVGADADDVEQEALIGLHNAVKDFRVDRQVSFRGFIGPCVTRQIISAVRRANRRKHQPLNRYLSTTAGQPSPDDPSIILDFVDDLAADPAASLVEGERASLVGDAFAKILAGLEAEVLPLYIEGRTYQEIGDELGREAKAIDNAVQRIKRKVQLHFPDLSRRPADFGEEG